ncbi:MAG: hypothetical protein WCR20_10240 [Verrucomicrobiota bacterium]
MKPTKTPPETPLKPIKIALQISRSDVHSIAEYLYSHLSGEPTNRSSEAATTELLTRIVGQSAILHGIRSETISNIINTAYNMRPASHKLPKAQRASRK